jgi:hypothetical protein
MLSKTNNKLVGDGTHAAPFVVCAWCFPGATLLQAFPQCEGKQVSHGCCPACKVAMLADLAGMQQVINKH